MATEIVTKKSKEKFYRGKNVEDLKELNIREFAKLVKSRPRRAILRNYDKIDLFINRCEEKAKKNRPLRTQDRELVIVPALIGKTLGVHNGKEYVRVDITHEMLGHRLGEFAPTRKVAKHTSLGKKKK